MDKPREPSRTITIINKGRGVRRSLLCGCNYMAQSLAGEDPRNGGAEQSCVRASVWLCSLLVHSRTTYQPALNPPSALHHMSSSSSTLGSGPIACPRSGCSNRELNFLRLDLGCVAHEARLVDEEFASTCVCSICHETVSISNAVMTPCLHLYCSGCINSWLRTNRTCPIDRRPLRETELQPATFVSQAMRGTRARCPYRYTSAADAVCHWKGRFETLESHIRLQHLTRADPAELEAARQRVKALEISSTLQAFERAQLEEQVRELEIARQLERMEFTSAAHWWDDRSFLVQLTHLLASHQHHAHRHHPGRAVMNRCFNWISNAYRNCGMTPGDSFLAMLMVAHDCPWFTDGQEEALYRMRCALLEGARFG